MATYSDSYNEGNVDILNGTNPNGNTFNLGLGLDWRTAAGNDTFNISGAMFASPDGNTFHCTGSNNVHQADRRLDGPAPERVHAERSRQHRSCRTFGRLLRCGIPCSCRRC